jgi:hypothetical protein
MRLLLFGTLFSLSWGIPPAAALAKMASPAQSVDVPMLFRGPSPAVNVYVNGKGPYLFLIDTGGQGSARADLSLVRQLNLAPVGAKVSGDGSGKNNRTLDEVAFDQISIGGLKFRNVRALTRDYNRSPKLPAIAGILGYNLFANHLLTLDFQRKRVRIETGSLPPPDGKTILGYEAPYDTPIIDVTMGGFRLLADIDSGDTNAITFPETLAKMLPHLSEPKVIGTGRTISNEFQVSEVKLRGVMRIGEHELADPTIRFNPIHDNINLGAGFLSAYVMTFDQKNRRIRILTSND